MHGWQVRDFVLEDLEELVRLDDLSTTTRQPPIFGLPDVVAALTARQPAVVAVARGRIVGSAVSRVEGERAWLLRLALDPGFRRMGLGSALLGALEHRLVTSGVRRLSAILPDAETGSQAFLNSGFTSRGGLSYFEKTEMVTPHAATLLTTLGGSVPEAGLWEQVAGMAREKELIERRLVLPLARPVQAHEHGVEPPRAVVLFGPPGTGKTTFAKAVASRLSWPFVELFPSRLAAEDGGLAAGISMAFARIAELDNVVVFIDEVEEIAAARESGGPSVAVVNELLKALVGFRERDGRLLVCATNSVRALDSAFLRHGRFDYVLPIGPPDETARTAMWQRHLGRTGDEVDESALVEASTNFTPADIAHAARTVAQKTFECTVDTGSRCHASTSDYLTTLAAMRPTLTDDMVREFEEDIGDFART
ncbi:ATP-binding protein [Nocardioides pakistanensis]